MKKVFSIFAIAALSAIFLSCGGKDLSKEEAKKQIDAYLNKQPPTFNIRCEDYASRTEYIIQLERTKKAGYLDYTFDVARDVNWVHVKLNDKVNPFILYKEHPQYYDGVAYYNVVCKAGLYECEIVSIAEPAPDASGSIVCNVEYKRTLVPNELYRVFGWVDVRNGSVRFIKMQDGWKLHNE